MSEATMATRGLVPVWDLADRLSKSLRVAGIGPGEMASYLEVSRNTVTNWTSGRTTPRTTDLRDWANRTGVSYEWLAHGINPAYDHEMAGLSTDKRSR